MSQSHQEQQSNLHIFSQTFNENSQDAHFISQLHQKYGIPIIQLQRIYLNAKTKRYNQSEDTTQLDFGQKLALNHNILKQMIDIIDNRSTITNHLRLSQSKDIKRTNFKRQPKQVQEKLTEIKSKLFDLISFIGQQQEQKKESIQIKKVVNLQDINQASYYNTSLQYSKEDFPLQQQSNTKQQKQIVFDRNKLELAKEVTSQMILSNSISQSSKNSREKQTFLKSSLDRISEVQSGETLERQFQQSRFRNTLTKPSQQSISVKRSSISEEHDEKLDQTGKIILSTINKKITKTSKISQKGKEMSKQTLPLNESNEYMKEQQRRSRFWKKKSVKLQAMASNFAVSHQQIQEAKKFQRSSFKFDQFNRGLTSKSLESIDKQREGSNQQHSRKLQASLPKQNLGQQKDLTKFSFQNKKHQIIHFPVPNTSKVSLNKIYPFPPVKKIHESMIVKSFPSLKSEQHMNLQPKINHLYHSQKPPLPTNVPQQRKYQTNRQFSQQKKSAISQQDRYQMKINQSIPYFASRQIIVSQTSPQVVHYRNSNKFYTNASSQIIHDPPYEQQLLATRSYSLIKDKPQPQPSKFVNPYINQIHPPKDHKKSPVTVYNDIRHDISNRSQSSKSSQSNIAIQSQSNLMIFTFNPNSNANKLKKRGILLTSGFQRNFNRRLT